MVYKNRLARFGFITLLYFFFVITVFSSAQAQTTSVDETLRANVHRFIDEWHDDAAHARWRYFDKIAKNGIFIGTDKTERWDRDAFKLWAKPHFEKKSAWAFTALQRNVYFSVDRQFIWFDEQLKTQFGLCQASGVIRATAHGFEIEHYQLSMAIPNDVANQVTALINDYESKPKK